MTSKKQTKKGSSALFKAIKWIFISGIIFVAYVAYILFAPNFTVNSDEKSYLHIPDKSSYENVLTNLKNEVSIFNLSSFKQVSLILQYKKHIHPGRYEIKQGMNNFELIRLLRSGRQTPVKLTFNNIRTKEQLAGRLGKQLMADSTSIINLLNDSNYLSRLNLNPNTSICLFIPNTYEVFWNIDAYKLFERMDKEYNKFWTDERKAQAATIPLTETEVSTLASIIEEETNNKKDRPMVAGLYINRLKMGMPMQADPTVKFAVGDFSIKRILSGHLKTESPYNTYKIIGLPPGPIRVATPDGIDAVLHYSHHNYIYMCASETLNGEHKFAITWKEHLINAKKYRTTLNEMNIH
ncbi:MAG: endolytic transglycosylase MltG [Paludibacter sp.]|nr:endolytic transglycosylase MltG [Paludibacter sp.]